MKFIAAIAADLETSPLGTRSRLRDELAGLPQGAGAAHSDCAR